MTGDHIFAILGSSTLLVLRPALSLKYYVVSICYAHGLVNDEPFLGPLPSPWKVQFRKHNGWLYIREFLDTVSGKISDEDPRMDQLATDWEKVEAAVRSSALPQFKNKTTGQIVETDPRLFPDHLKKRGIKVQSVHLI